MSVPEQVPYKEYRATGSNNSFEITFYLPDPKDLVVMVNKEIPLVGAYSIQGNTVVFNTAPNEGDLVELTRDTQLDRETEYKSYDNSFRPETINFDLDKIWLVLQESNLVDAKILARLKQEIEWRRTHDFNYDELAQVREKQLFDALKGYSETLLASTNPGVFQGVIAGVVFARDGKSIQTHIEEILNNLELNRSYIDEQLSLKAPQATTYNKIEVDTKIEEETMRAQAAEQVLQNQVNAVGVGNKAYLTYALMDADKVNIPAKSKVTVTNDATTSNNGDWQWDGATFTKSAFDPLTQANKYTLEQKATLLTDADNLLENTTLLFGYIGKNGTDRNESESSNWRKTDFINVSHGDRIQYSLTATNLVAVIAAYDASQKFLRDLTNEFTLNTPTQESRQIEIDDPSIIYIRLSFVHSASYSFIRYKFKLNEKLLDLNMISEKTIEDLSGSKNLYSELTVTDNFPLINNILTAGYPNWFTTDFIAVTPEQSYTTNGATAGSVAGVGIHYYDSSKNFISVGLKQKANVPFTIPSGVSFIRLSFAKPVSPAIDKIWVVKGEQYKPDLIEEKVAQ